MKINLDTEVNKCDYPYYRYIPIENICHKQKQLINKLEETDVNKLEETDINLVSNLDKIKMEIEKNYEIIKLQEQTITANKIIFEEQHNIYNYNNNYINTQSYYVAHNNNIIVNQKELIDSLENQIIQYQNQLEDIQYENEKYKQELDYHSNMITAFNNLIMNPESFSQIMNMTLSYTPE